MLADGRKLQAEPQAEPGEGGVSSPLVFRTQNPSRRLPQAPVTACGSGPQPGQGISTGCGALGQKEIRLPGQESPSRVLLPPLLHGHYSWEGHSTARHHDLPGGPHPSWNRTDPGHSQATEPSVILCPVLGPSYASSYCIQSVGPILIFPFGSRGNGGSEKLMNLPKITQL